MESSIWTAGSADGFRIGRERDDNDPHPINTPKNAHIKSISASWKNGYFVTSKNEFYSWGTGQSWRLATGNRIDAPTPQLVTTFPSDFEFQLIVSGDKFGAALSENGQVMAWGSGYAHSPTLLPLETTAVHIAADQKKLICALSDGRVAIVQRHDPVTYVKIPNNNIVKVAIGTSHYLALSEDGIAFSWGGDSPGTGQPSETLEPTEVPNLPHTIQGVFASHNNSWFVDIEGTLYYCGGNIDGSLGVGSTAVVRTVTRHPFRFGDAPVVQVGCGDNFTLVLNSAGQVFAAGCANDGRTMVPNPSMTTEFQECTIMKGHMVTQISCGCYSSALLVNGAPPPELGVVLLKNFREFKISTQASVVGPHGKRINLDQDDAVLFQNGLQKGDILADRRIKEENQCMVIGSCDEIIYVIRESDCKIIPIDAHSFTGIISAYELVERPGAELFRAHGIGGGSVAVDNTKEAMSIFNGLLIGDHLDDDTTLAGARGPHLFGMKDGVLQEVDFNAITSVTRNGEVITSNKMADGKVCFVQAAPEKGRIFIERNFGACEFVGFLPGMNCYASPADFGSLRVIEGGVLARTNAGNDTRSLFLPTMDPCEVQISIENTFKLGFIATDLVQTPNGMGFVTGRFKDEIAVRLEHHRNNFGSVTLFKPSDLTLCGRINYEGTRTINGVTLSVNTQDFNEAKVLPGDMIETEEGKIVTVVGVKEGKAFILCDGELKPLANVKNLIRRSLPVYGVNEYEEGRKVIVSTCMLGLSRFMPGESQFSKGVSYRFLGLTADMQFLPLFLNESTKEIVQMNSVSFDLSI